MSKIVADVMGAIRAVASPLVDPNTIFVFNPQRFRDLLAAPPPVFTVEEPWSLRMRWHMPTSLLEPRHLGRVSMAVVDGEGPEAFELRCGPYEDVFEPWCVLKNLATGRRLVVDWPLTPYYADRLVRRSS